MSIPELFCHADDQGGLLAFQVSPGNVDDCKPGPESARDLWGKLVGDSGNFAPPLFERLCARGLQLNTLMRGKRRSRLVSSIDGFGIGDNHADLLRDCPGFPASLAKVLAK